MLLYILSQKFLLLLLQFLFSEEGEVVGLCLSSTNEKNDCFMKTVVKLMEFEVAWPLCSYNFVSLTVSLYGYNRKIAIAMADEFVLVDRCIHPEHDLRWFIWKEWGSDLPQGENSQDQQRKRGEVVRPGLYRCFSYGVPICKWLKPGFSFHYVESTCMSPHINYFQVPCLIPSLFSPWLFKGCPVF